MTKIISMSLDQETLDDLDQIHQALGFSGRSEAIRAGIKELILQYKNQNRFKGRIDASILVVHKEKHADQLAKIRHKYEKIIKTQLHNHLDNHKCLDIFVLNGDAKQILKLSKELQTNKKIDQAKLIVP